VDWSKAQAWLHSSLNTTLSQSRPQQVHHVDHYIDREAALHQGEFLPLLCWPKIVASTVETIFLARGWSANFGGKTSKFI